ncbi:F-box/kelch-repeat protein At3g23880-like [Trifolium pratense]|uniref:F-box/kelch-repeat protein At3g23880-like n=1 Tax=Trifolium pratense TaxID=57577 RepID=UPI001E692ADE|nr:F-box/kelch-repeat protein At3g23880-like [Trifolium pratense]
MKRKSLSEEENLFRERENLDEKKKKKKNNKKQVTTTGILTNTSCQVAGLRVTLPEDLIGEVLSYLTVKSLMRMKCVNKSWKTLISDPIFVKMHLMRSPRNTHFVLPFVNNYRGLSRFVSANILPISVSHFLKSWRTTVIRLTEDPYRRFRSKDLRRIVGSCNGLICLLDSSTSSADYVEHSYSLYFWNPATRTKSEKLGFIGNNRNFHTFDSAMFTFGCDNSTDTYKVVWLNFDKDNCYNYNRSIRTTVKVFTLGDNVWRDIDCFPVVLVDYPDCLVQHDGVYFSDAINWLVYHEYNCHLKNLMIREHVIVSLDLGTETYSQLLLPQCCNNEMSVDPTPALFVFMDCLCLSYDFEKTYFVIWQMKEFGVEESWTQFLKISYLDLNINISDLEYGMRLFPLCFSDDDALILGNNFGYAPILYDWRNNRVKIIKSTKFGDKTNHGTICYDDWYHAKEYSVESLVSPC